MKIVGTGFLEWFSLQRLLLDVIRNALDEKLEIGQAVLAYTVHNGVIDPLIKVYD